MSNALPAANATSAERSRIALAGWEAKTATVKPSSAHRASGSAVAKLRGHLFDQQLWCWGRDAAHPEGNLLVAYGFTRTARPVGRSCASLYRLEHRAGARIVLRGFGAFLGDDRHGGVFIPRQTARAHLTPLPDFAVPPWEPDELPALREPERDCERRTCEELHGELCEWVVAYERWVVARCGIAYRMQSANAWRQIAKRKYVPYRTVKGAWRDWGRELLAGSLPHPASMGDSSPANSTGPLRYSPT